MSEFEFFLIVFAIILGFGLAEILAGWGEQVGIGITIARLASCPC